MKQLNLLPRTHWTERWLLPALFIIGAAAGLAALLIWHEGGKWQEKIEATERRVNELKAQIGQLEQKRADDHDLKLTAQFIKTAEELRSNRRLWSPALAELADLLPASVRIRQISLDDAAVMNAMLEFDDLIALSRFLTEVTESRYFAKADVRSVNRTNGDSAMLQAGSGAYTVGLLLYLQAGEVK
jgi:Tfp pilus assembly protein PilN